MTEAAASSNGQAPFRPNRDALQRSRDFLTASAAPRRGSIAAALGFGAAQARDVNPQEAEAAPPDSIANFLFVRPEPEAKQRSLVAHTGNLTFAAAHEMVNILLPFLNKSVGGDVTSFAHLKAGYNGLNAVGSAFFGALTDRFGPKCGLMLAHASSAASFCLLGRASSVNALYLASLPAIGMHSFQTAMTVVSLNSDHQTRASALGRIGSMYGFGFLAGSAIMIGALRLMTPRHIILVAAGMEFAALGLIASAYPSDGIEPNREEEIEQTSISSLQVFSRPGVASVLTFKFILVSTAGAVTFMTQQFAMHPFGFSELEVAMLMAFVGGLHMLSGSLVSDATSPTELYFTSAACVGCSLLGMGLAPSSKHAFVMCLTPLMLSFHAANTMLGSLLTLYVPEDETDTVLGLSVATMPAGHIVASLYAAYVFKAHGFAAVPLSTGALLISGTGLLYLVGFMPPALEDTARDDIE